MTSTNQRKYPLPEFLPSMGVSQANYENGFTEKRTHMSDATKSVTTAQRPTRNTNKRFTKLFLNAAGATNTRARNWTGRF